MLYSVGLFDDPTPVPRGDEILYEQTLLHMTQLHVTDSLANQT